jgi:hypothetical protein
VRARQPRRESGASRRRKGRTYRARSILRLRQKGRKANLRTSPSRSEREVTGRPLGSRPENRSGCNGTPSERWSRPEGASHD